MIVHASKFIYEPTYFRFIHESVQTINGTVTGGTFATGSSNSERDWEKVQMHFVN